MADMQNQESFWGGTPARTEQTTLFNQGQQGAQGQVLQQLMQMLQQGNQGQYKGFAPIAQQARTGFEQQTVPGLAERFTSMGSGASLSSPSFASQLGQHASGLEQGIAALKANYGQTQQGLNNQRFGQLGQLGFQPSFENTYFKRQPGFGEQAGQGIAGGIGAILPLLGLLFGGPAGAAAGTSGSAGLAGLMSLLNNSQGGMQ